MYNMAQHSRASPQLTLQDVSISAGYHHHDAHTMGGGYHKVIHRTPYNMGGGTPQSLLHPTHHHRGGVVSVIQVVPTRSLCSPPASPPLSKCKLPIWSSPDPRTTISVTLTPPCPKLPLKPMFTIKPLCPKLPHKPLFTNMSSAEVCQCRLVWIWTTRPHP
jgi:hypothetical protein